MTKVQRFLVLLGLLGLSQGPVAQAWDQEFEDEVLEEEADSDTLDPFVLWTCTARGRVDANIYAEFPATAKSYFVAQKLALAKCRNIAQGCRITGCRPGT